MCRLLQRKCASDVLGVDFSGADIRRTKGGKPFAVAVVARPHAPNFNFNVSHEVIELVLSCPEPLCLYEPDVNKQSILQY